VRAAGKAVGGRRARQRERTVRPRTVLAPPRRCAGPGAVLGSVVNVAALGGAWNGITEGGSLWRAGAGVGGAGAGAARARRPPRAPNVGPAEG